MSKNSSGRLLFGLSRPYNEEDHTTDGQTNVIYTYCETKPLQYAGYSFVVDPIKELLATSSDVVVIGCQSLEDTKPKSTPNSNLYSMQVTAWCGPSQRMTVKTWRLLSADPACV